MGVMTYTKNSVFFNYNTSTQEFDIFRKLRILHIRNDIYVLSWRRAVFTVRPSKSFLEKKKQDFNFK